MSDFQLLNIHMKHLCDLNKKGYDKVASKIVSLVNHPQFVCKKCLRAANSQDRVCKPIALEKEE